MNSGSTNKVASDDCSTIAFTRAISLWRACIRSTERRTRRPIITKPPSAIAVARMLNSMPRSPASWASVVAAVLASSSTSLSDSWASRRTSSGATAASYAGSICSGVRAAAAATSKLSANAVHASCAASTASISAAPLPVASTYERTSSRWPARSAVASSLSASNSSASVVTPFCSASTVPSVWRAMAVPSPIDCSSDNMARPAAFTEPTDDCSERIVVADTTPPIASRATITAPKRSSRERVSGWSADRVWARVGVGAADEVTGCMT